MISEISASRSEAPAYVIACEAVPLREVPSRAGMTRPDVVLLEQGADGQEIAPILTQLRCASPASRTIVLCDSCTRERMIDAVRYGAAGYVTRPADVGLLGKAVRTLHQGGDWFGRTDLLQALRSLVDPKSGLPDDKLHVLTDREQQILNLAGCGLSNKEIARHLLISDHTVKTHLHRVYVKLNSSGRYRVLQAHPVARIVVRPPVPPTCAPDGPAPCSDFMRAPLPR